MYDQEDFSGLSPPDLWSSSLAEREETYDHFNNFYDPQGGAGGVDGFVEQRGSGYVDNAGLMGGSNDVVMMSSTDVVANRLAYGVDSGGSTNAYGMRVTGNWDIGMPDVGSAIAGQRLRTISEGSGSSTTTGCGPVFGNEDSHDSQYRGTNVGGRPGWELGHRPTDGGFPGGLFEIEKEPEFTQLGESFDWLQNSVDVGKIVAGGGGSISSLQYNNAPPEDPNAAVFIKSIVDECKEFEKKISYEKLNSPSRSPSATTGYAPSPPAVLPPTPPAVCPMMSVSPPRPQNMWVPSRFPETSFQGTSVQGHHGVYVPTGQTSPDLVTMGPLVYSPVHVGQEVEVAAMVPHMSPSPPASDGGYRSSPANHEHSYPVPIPVRTPWSPVPVVANGASNVPVGNQSPSVISQVIVAQQNAALPTAISSGAKHLLSIPIDGSITLTPGTIIQVTVSNGTFSVGQLEPVLQAVVEPATAVPKKENGVFQFSGYAENDCLLPLLDSQLTSVISVGNESAARNAATNLVANRVEIRDQLVAIAGEAKAVATFANNHPYQEVGNGNNPVVIMQQQQQQQSGGSVVVPNEMIKVVAGEEVVLTNGLPGGTIGLDNNNGSLIIGSDLGAPVVAPAASLGGIPKRGGGRVAGAGGKDQKPVQRGRKFLPKVVGAGEPSPASGSSALGQGYPRGERPYPVQKEIKKQQNREAALRYRQKKKHLKNGCFSELDALEGRNTELHDKVGELEREVSYLKNLMAELKQMKEG